MRTDVGESQAWHLELSDDDRCDDPRIASRPVTSYFTPSDSPSTLPWSVRHLRGRPEAKMTHGTLPISGKCKGGQRSPETSPPR